MIRRPPRSTRTDTLFPYTTLFRALAATRQMGDRIDRVVLASVEGTDQTLKLPARTDAFLERVGALLQNDPKAVSLPPLPDLMRHVLAELEQEIGRASCRERVCK